MLSNCYLAFRLNFHPGDPHVESALKNGLYVLQFSKAVRGVLHLVIERASHETSIAAHQGGRWLPCHCMSARTFPPFDSKNESGLSTKLVLNYPSLWHEGRGRSKSIFCTLWRTSLLSILGFIHQRHTKPNSEELFHRPCSAYFARHLA